MFAKMTNREEDYMILNCGNIYYYKEGQDKSQNGLELLPSKRDLWNTAIRGNIRQRCTYDNRRKQKCFSKNCTSIGPTIGTWRNISDLLNS